MHHYLLNSPFLCLSRLYHWSSKRTRDEKLSHLWKKNKALGITCFNLFPAGKRIQVYLWLSLYASHYTSLLLTLPKITIWTDAFYATCLSQICWIVCLFSYDKTSIKMICLFLGTWQETNMLYFPCQKAENFLKVALISKQELILPRDFWCCYFCSLHGHPPEVWSNYKLLKNCNLASKGVILRSKWETVTVTTNDQTIWMPSIWKVTVLAPCSIACSQKRT